MLKLSKQLQQSPDMIGSSTGGATAFLVAKYRTKKNFLNIMNFNYNFVIFRGKNWLKAFYTFFIEGYLKIMHHRFQVNSMQIEGFTMIFVIFFIMTILI